MGCLGETKSWIIYLIWSSIPLVISEFTVNPYPARIYAGAPKDVPVLQVTATDNATGLPITKFVLDAKSDAKFFRIDSNGTLFTKETIDFNVGREFSFFIFAIVNKDQEYPDKYADYRQASIRVSEKNVYPPQFNLTQYMFPVYRYGVGDKIGCGSR
ncbi:uncharacterized protein LOC131951621 [Physella acuta]|uniref:uncharacterized protein LOC131951621 n=1 Tax=Physella acuta TaxID=109671 RepID=UPI0027DC1EAF|nr:uncharacterized protein LOC131951621 [Physella acuta]